MKLALYLARTMIGAISLVTVIFFSLILFISVVSEMTQTGDGQYHFFQALHYVFFMLPLTLYQIFPMMVLVGVLVGLGSLSTTNELTVMRTSGLSINKITTIVLIAAFFVVAIATAIGEGLAPYAAFLADRQKLLDQNNGRLVSTLTGVWLKQDNDFFHIMSVPDGQHMMNITRFHFNEQRQLVSSAFAESSQYINQQWTFFNVQTSNISPTGVKVTQEKQTIWPLNFNFHQFADIDPHELDLLKLNEQINYTKANGINASKYAVILWGRIFQPITTLVMVLVAIPFIFGPLRTVSIGLRLLSGITVGLVFYIINQFVTSLGMAYQINPVALALALPTCFLLFAIVLFKWKA
jgi:lipopolysaccharide export system permease protein